MKKILTLTTAVLCLGLFAVMVGCEDSGPGADGASVPVMAWTIEDGADKYAPQQDKCPVCGGRPIKAEFYTEIDGKRLYFDKQECVQKYEENPDEYQVRDPSASGMGQ